MPSAKRAPTKQVRRSVSLPQRVAKQIEAIAKQRALSDNRVLVELIEQGIEASKQKEKAFFQLAERFRAAEDPGQVKQLGDELGRFVFGQDRWLVNSRAEVSARIRRGLDQLNRGEGIPEDQLDAYMARMKTQPE